MVKKRKCVRFGVLTLEIGHLAVDHVDVVVANQLLGGAVVAVGGAGHIVVLLRRAGLGQHLVIPHAGLPAARPDARVRLSDAVGRLERPSVERHPEHDLAGRHPAVDVRRDRRVRGEGRGHRVLGVGVQVRLVARGGVPRAGVVVRHQVEVVEQTGHLAEVELVVVGRAGGNRGGQEEVVVAGLRGLRVLLGSYGLEEGDHVAGLGVVGGVLPVDIEAVEAPVPHQSHCCLCKGGSGRIGASSRCKVGGVRPSTY